MSLRRPLARQFTGWRPRGGRWRAPWRVAVVLLVLVSVGGVASAAVGAAPQPSTAASSPVVSGFVPDAGLAVVGAAGPTVAQMGSPAPPFDRRLWYVIGDWFGIVFPIALVLYLLPLAGYGLYRWGMYGRSRGSQRK